MAVYTKIDEELLKLFLKNYNLGNLLSFVEVQEGVENSTYKLKMSSGTYILSIFEKRVKEEDLSFFIKLKNHLINKNFLCREPISNNDGDYINRIKNKCCVVIKYLNGKNIEIIENIHCNLLGNEVAQMHIKASDFKLTRKNSLNQKNWKNLFKNFKNNKNNNFSNLFDNINNELIFLDERWPNELPVGIIHADIFKDNVLFENNKISGIIDFYFACNDFFAYELAICINAWCFNSNNQMDLSKVDAFLKSYQNHRKLSNIEKSKLPILLRGAAIRFLLTRLNDHIYHPQDANVKPKDPIEYFNILSFHQNNNILNQVSF